MTIWLDAQLSPSLAAWITREFSISASHVRDFTLIEASDPDIFKAARAANAIVLTKDRDFIDLVRRHGPPPHIIWLTTGNSSNQQMHRILSGTLRTALELVVKGEPVVEIRDPW